MMATSIIEVVIGKLAGAIVGKLGEMAVEQVANQASLLLHFRKDFEWLQKELTKVIDYLQYEHHKKESVKKWFADVKDIALDAEDMVEECDVQSLYGSSPIFRYKMGRRIRKLKERMQSIMKDLADLNHLQQVCHQPLISDGRAEEWKKSGPIERDAKPVAIDAKVEQIIHFLEDDAVQVIAVVGMGGIGKTFLLQNVYNHPKVRQRFEKAIWLSISQVYSVARLQYDIASHLVKDVKKGGVNEQQAAQLIQRKDKNFSIELIKEGGVSEQRAAELIQESLRDKNCLIVLDDVWRMEGVKNLIQRLGLPGGTSKVVVTTRSMEVCNIMGASQIYRMELLSQQDSWKLFCLHAFPDDQQYRPTQELYKVALQVEKECSRLPLAIKTVAASMAGQKLLIDWESKLRQLKEVSDPDDTIMPILALSYNALPAALKPCFLYLSFFGEDVEIDAEYLIYLWIGEGFIPKGKEQWSSGWNYLKQLNNLCLVEVSEDEQLKKTCKIHDLVLDLAISISGKNKCAFTVEEASAIGCRRILLTKKGLDDAGIKRFKCPQFLRTLSLSQNTIEELPTKSLRGVQAIRVIDISYTCISLLPRCIGNFKLLSVLNLSNNRVVISKVPDCVRNLKNLCFLNVDTCPLPKWIGDLKCLQHLHVFRVYYKPEILRGISKLVSLRTLRIDDWCRLVLKDVAKLIHLQELRIEIANDEEEKSLEEGILSQLVNMRHLTIFGPARDSMMNLPHFPEKMKAMKNLEYLDLRRFTVPRWIWKYGNLRVLVLDLCDSTQCAALETMPNLMKLEFTNCHCKELPESFGKSGAFPQLRSFVISGFSQMKKLPDLQHGAMPRLEVFDVYGCKGLQKIPEGFEHLRSLKRLVIDMRWNMKYKYVEEKKLKEGGEYWNKIKANNPDVTIIVKQ